MLVQDFLQNSAKAHPDKTALVCGSRRFTYQELDGMANRLANALRREGVQRGDRVAIYLSNCVEQIVGIFGILKADAIFVSLGRTTKGDKLVSILNNCQAKALLLDKRAVAQGVGERVLSEVKSLGGLIICGEAGLALKNGHGRHTDFATIQASNSSERPKSQNIDLDLACLIYTSGTTGESKGVMCDHSNIRFRDAIDRSVSEEQRERYHNERFADGVQLWAVSVDGDVLRRRDAGAGGIVRIPGHGAGKNGAGEGDGTGGGADDLLDDTGDGFGETGFVFAALFHECSGGFAGRARETVAANCFRKLIVSDARTDGSCSDDVSAADANGCSA